MEEATIEELQSEIQGLKVELMEANDRITELEKNEELMKEAFDDIEKMASRFT